jgi:hypothetical protein
MVAMAKAPVSVEIREYQMGFGDCFLVSFLYGKADKRHVLIDFGTTELPSRGTPLAPAPQSEYMPLVAHDIEKACGGSLTAVVATHRHADHISGFATDSKTGGSGKIIGGLRPRVVLQPWTEDPDAAVNAHTATRDSTRSPKSFTDGLAAMQHIASAVCGLAMDPPARMRPSMLKELAFIGQCNIANESAVKNLMDMGEAAGATAVWAHHGSDSGLEPLLPGVRVSVLGPPDLTQTEGIKKMRKTDPDQFWHLLSSARHSDALARGLPVRGATRFSGSIPMEARWFKNKLDGMRADQLLQIVRTLDDQMNNTSLILLFEVSGKKLLFPGDAQIENWSWALEDSPDCQATRSLLSEVDVYKVGHHGSLNATPKTLLWENFRKRGKSDSRLITLLSTLHGKHGKTRDGTEVPRGPLLKALGKETTLYNTDGMKSGKDPVLCQLIEIK